MALGLVEVAFLPTAIRNRIYKYCKSPRESDPYMSKFEGPAVR
jgi:hypothetical protein